MFHAMRSGAGTSAYLNKHGASANWFTVESQGHPVSATAENADDVFGTSPVGYGLWKWDLSLSQLRYKSPLKEFLSIYRNYRIRQCQVHFYPIKLDTTYTVGSSTKKVATTLEDLANDTFSQFEESQFVPDEFSTQLQSATIPRVGPVAACFIPLNKDQGLKAEDLTSSSFADFAKAYDSKIFGPTGDQLPEIKLEYNVPIDAVHQMAGFRDPHPETRYRSTVLADVNEAWPRLGTFWLRTSECMKGIPLYHTRVRVLVETSSLMDVPVYPPWSSLASGNRRLNPAWNLPDSGLLEDSSHPAVVADVNNVSNVNNNNASDPAMQASISTNSTNIATLTSNVAALTTLVGTMNTTLTNVNNAVSHFQNSSMPAPTWHDLSQSVYSKTQGNTLASGVTENLFLNPKYSSASSFYNVGSYAYDPHEDASGNGVPCGAKRPSVYH